MKGGPASSLRAATAAIVTVAATYAYFLIFAEFAFLALVRAAFTEPGTVKLVMGGMGGGGVLGGVAAAATFSREGWRWRLAAWFAGCALAAALVAGVAGGMTVSVSLPAALAVGLALGGLTVTLAAGLRPACGGRLGIVCGVGTGIGYAVCNVPALFLAAPVIQCWFAVVVALAGVVSCLYLRADDATAEPVKTGGIRRWVVALAALVWMDSAAFAVIQQETALRAATWTSLAHLWAYAALHLAVAVWAGWALLFGLVRWIAFAAWVLLAGACAMLWWSPETAGGASWPYVAAVSLYSAVLVYVPARSGRPWVAAAVYALAGWIGSALGIGMAQDLTGIPGWFAPVTGVVVFLALFWRGRLRKRVLLLCLNLICIVTSLDAGEVERGREVYISEGCIHCHSQYVRPDTRDVEWWGPVIPLSESLKERPPLFGNRRQGPDLANVGLRRTAEWNRLHMIDPRSISPGSRMPSYGYLFADEGTRGNDLLAYLGSLGEKRLEERMALVAAWRPMANKAEIMRVDARRLFGGLCAPCHGKDGLGNGPLARFLAVPPPDFSSGWRRPPGSDDDGVARIIKFGLPGTAMAGHETLSDAEVVSLARLVKSLHPAATAP